MYFHGGGWVLGDVDTHDRLIREIANGANAAVVFVNYSRPPEARYPVAIEEAYAATKWVSANGKTIHVDSSRLAVAGDSVGGNMAAAVTLLAKQRGGPPIHFQVLFYPVTDADFDTPSYQQFAQGYFLTRQSMKWFWDHYAPDVAIRMQATASPLRATIDQLRGLPPALVINGECDVLRDEGEAYARKLIQAGVHVTALRYLGTIHDFVMLNAITDTPAAQAPSHRRTTRCTRSSTVRQDHSHRSQNTDECESTLSELGGSSHESQNRSLPWNHSRDFRCRSGQLRFSLCSRRRSGRNAAEQLLTRGHSGGFREDRGPHGSGQASAHRAPGGPASRTL